MNFIRYKKLKIDNFIKFTVPLFFVLNALRMHREMYLVYYVTQAMLLMYVIIIIKEDLYNNLKIAASNKKYLFLISLFPVWALLTALWSLNPMLSIIKGLNYFFVLAGLSAITILWIKHVKENIFLILLPANIFVLVSSCLSLFLKIPSDAWNVGHGLGFAGLFPHQNLMAMALLFTMPGIFYFVIDDENKKNNKLIYFFYLLLASNIILITLTYSRTAILSLFLGFTILILLVKYYKLILLFYSVLLIIGITVLCITPLNALSQKILAKHNMPIFATREILWEPSYEASKLGGIAGLGFGIAAPGIKILGRDNYNKESGLFYREKGNSLLALIEETGLIGTICFLFPIIFALIKLWKNKKNLMNKILLTTLCCFIFHGNFEAWFIAAGSLAFPMFLILLIFVIFK